MEIRRYEPRMARALTAVYNEAVRPVPHCYPVRQATMAAALDGTLVDAGRDQRHDDAVFVAHDGTEVVGFAHVAIGPAGRDDPADAGLLRFLWYRPGQRRAGDALAETAESYARDHGVAQVIAFRARHRYPFYYLQPARLSIQVGHVAALLGMRGYTTLGGEVFFDWRNFAVSAPAQDAFDLRYTVEYPQGAGRRPGVVVRAWQGERPLGVCVNECAGNHTTARGAQDWLFTDWLGVEEEFQGRGLGRSLLQRALAAGRAVGYRHACISTDWRNFRAFLFYSNCGYHVSDWTYSYTRRV